jgi:hypothetical protein
MPQLFFKDTPSYVRLCLSGICLHIDVVWRSARRSPARLVSVVAETTLKLSIWHLGI